MQVKPILVFSTHQCPVTCVTYWTDEQTKLVFVASGDEVGQLLVWILSSGQTIAFRQVSQSPILAVKCLRRPDSLLLYTQTKDGFLFVIRFEKQIEYKLTPLLDFECCNTSFCNLDLISVCNSTALIALLDRDSNCQLNLCLQVDDSIRVLWQTTEFEGLGCISTIRLIKSSQTKDNDSIDMLLMIGFENGQIQMTRLRLSEQNNRLEKIEDWLSITNLGNYITCIDCCQHASIDDCLRVYCGSSNQKLQMLRIGFDSINNRLQMVDRRSITLTNYGLSSMSIRSDGRLLASGGWDNRIRLFSTKSNAKLAVLDFHTQTINSVCFVSSPTTSNHLLIAVSKDELISVWNIFN